MKKNIVLIVLVLFSAAGSAMSAVVNTFEDVKVNAIIVSNEPYVDVRAFSNLSSAKISSQTAGKTILITNRQAVNNLNIPRDRNIRFEKGGLITVNPGKTLKFDNNLQAGSYQIFSGKGVVTGLTDINAAWWGAFPSASVTTNTAAILASIAALSNQGYWLLPAGEYKTNDSLVFKNLSDSTIHFQGRIVNNTSDGIILDNLNRCTVTGIDVGRSKLVPGNWSGSGLSIVNALNRCMIQVDRIFGFEHGLKIYATSNNPLASGMAWNSFKLGELRDNQYGILVGEEGQGYFNQNTFSNGMIRCSQSTIDNYPTGFATTWGIYFQNPAHWIYSNNVFWNIDMSALANGMRITGAYNFLLDGVRFETITNYHLEAQSGSSLVIRPATDFDASKYLFSNNMRGVNIIGAAKYSSSTYKSMIMDNRFGGITFADPTAIDSTLMHLYTDLANRSGLVFSSYLNGTQNFDKQFTSSAIPSKGTYDKNAVIWNTAVATGQPIGWVASRRGTMGILTGVKGYMKSGSPVLIVNDSTRLKIGESVTVAGAVPMATILKISGSTVTLDANATASVIDAEVTYHPAEWVKMPNFQ